ncbi:hypothetical protein [Actinomycetospora chibensis]|jgi:hypothetical protein|uniref:Roadblock/LAMTOR2 domain-containing protein n=1 Tax=Actinomycetospora chibensis TaxID=663606 RepID=A0ABV9RJY4_9PSEU|nr:hypothetical protein [Actinomycetospora chibensis]MDD7927352.1 hypothetical protein [Actinomycetospora chibensis]
MAADDALWSALGRVAETPTLLVACAFDGALAAEEGDPAEARAEQQSSEALNVLIALHRTTVAVVSERPAEEVAELMFLSGAKGGARVVAPEGVAALRDEVGATAVVAVGLDHEPGADDVVIGVAAEAPYEVEDVDDVCLVLEELAGLRRGY